MDVAKSALIATVLAVGRFVEGLVRLACLIRPDRSSRTRQLAAEIARNARHLYQVNRLPDLIASDCLPALRPSRA